MKFLFKCNTVILGLLIIVSCTSDILDYNDPNNIDTQSYFNTPEQIELSANAIYSGFFYGRMFGWKYQQVFDALANELAPQPPALSNEPNIVAFWKYQFNSNNDCITGYWKMLYRLILRCNLTIDKGNEYLENDNSNQTVREAIGQAYFIRGWAYTQLAFYWGRVPLRTVYDQTGNENAPRSDTVEEVWAIAENDLKEAQSLLPSKWNDANIGRATSGAATAFLGKLLLFNNRYQEAENEFSKIASSYSLVTADEWYDMFTERSPNGRESIFEIQFKYWDGVNAPAAIWDDPEGANSWNVLGRETGHNQLYGWNDWNNWNFQPRRIDDFKYKDETGKDYVDPRAKLTFYEKAGGIGDDVFCEECADGPIPFEQNDPYYKKYLNKEYKFNESNCHSSNNLILMRYADVILMRAECALKVSDVSKAISFINEVRKRIGAYEYTQTYTADQVFELLKRERQIELMGEYHRFDDLKRWGILKETMDPEMAAIGSSPIDSKFYLWPIPQTEIDSNPGLGTVANDWN